MLEVAVAPGTRGWTADVTVKRKGDHRYRVEVTEDEHGRYCGASEHGDGRPTARDVERLVARSFEFLLEREEPTSILRTFSLRTIEGYFPDYPKEIRRRTR
ncbi:MAG TPA: hypothetical protein VMJ92_03650 [Candidatus Limnocylindrales bacterium]|nr:hypothetical protein [Candidatus Limnocylindrales bacterium]